MRETVKPLGDFTSNIGQLLEVGQAVRIQGPFGRFKMAPRKRQVWIVGGIGITPFLTWAQALRADAPAVDLFYCVKSRTQASHIEEVVELTDELPNLNLHLFVSSEGQRLTACAIRRWREYHFVARNSFGHWSGRVGESDHQAAPAKRLGAACS